MLLTPQATPIQVLHDPLFDRHGVRVLIKRVDLVHAVISGNKWYKLKYNLLAAQQHGYKTLLSFGGAYSNHIHALAGAGHMYGFRTIGLIRGEPYQPLNPTLQFAVDHGMALHYLSRAEYRMKDSSAMIERLRQQFGDFYLLPEGGTNALAVQGCSEMLADVDADVDAEFDVVACACGTGGTLAGVVAGLKGTRRALGVAVLKGGEFLRDEVRRLLQEYTRLARPDERGHSPGYLQNYKEPRHSGLRRNDESTILDGAVFNNWQIECSHHHGGYAKTTPELMAFMQRFEQQHGILLDPIYTAKLFLALYTLVEQQQFARGTTLLAIHSGGLQGRAGFGLN